MKPNDSVGGYHFVALLGEGPSGRVWLAREEDSALYVAIKLLKSELFATPQAQAIYERLVSAVTDIGRLTHPNLAQVRTTFHHPRMGLYGLVSEYVEGRALDGIYVPKTPDGRPGASDPRTLAGVLAWFQQIATVLAWLHANRIVHGSVKPRNVMLMTESERPAMKLLDLCWARAGIDAPEDERFVPPERVAGERPTALSDQWGAARILHNLLITSAPGSPSEALTTAPVTLLKVVQRALHKDPRQRYPDTGAFFYALESVRHQLEQSAAAESGRSKGPGPAPSWEALKRIPSEPVSKAEPGQMPTLPTEPIEFIPPPAIPRILPRDAPSEDAGPGATLPPKLPRKSEIKPAAGLSRDRGAPRGPAGDLDLRQALAIDPSDTPGIDEFFRESDPPLIAPPPRAPKRAPSFATIDPEVVDSFDPEMRVPGKNWPALAGIAALAALIVFIAGGIYLLTRPSQAPLVSSAAGDAGRALASRADAAMVAGNVPPTATATQAAAFPLSRTATAVASSARPDAATPATSAPAPAVASSARHDAATPATSAPAPASSARLDAATPAKSAPAPAPTAAPPPAAAPLPSPSPAPARPADSSGLAELEAECRSNKAAACADLGERYLAGNGAPRSSAKAASAFERACDLGRLNACVKAGDELAHDASEDGGRRARRAYERACDNQVAIACELLAKLYREGIGGPANERTAKAFRARACAFGRKESC